MPKTLGHQSALPAIALAFGGSTEFENWVKQTSLGQAQDALGQTPGTLHVGKLTLCETWVILDSSMSCVYVI